jgi:hypothetical protein
LNVKCDILVSQTLLSNSNLYRYAAVAGLLKQSKQNAASLNFGRVAFPEGDGPSDAAVLRSKRGVVGSCTS